LSSMGHTIEHLQRGRAITECEGVDSQTRRLLTTPPFISARRQLQSSSHRPSGVGNVVHPNMTSPNVLNRSPVPADAIISYNIRHQKPLARALFPSPAGRRGGVEDVYSPFVCDKTGRHCIDMIRSQVTEPMGAQIKSSRAILYGVSISHPYLNQLSSKSAWHTRPCAVNDVSNAQAPPEPLSRTPALPPPRSWINASAYRMSRHAP
jgi:hypothetical protein